MANNPITADELLKVQDINSAIENVISQFAKLGTSINQIKEGIVLDAKEIQKEWTNINVGSNKNTFQELIVKTEQLATAEKKYLEIVNQVNRAEVEANALIKEGNTLMAAAVQEQLKSSKVYQDLMAYKKASNEEKRKENQLIRESEQEQKRLTAAQQKQAAQEQANKAIMADTSGSLVIMRKQLSLLSAEYANLAKAERESTSGIALGRRVKDLSESTKELEQGMGNYTRNVGNYGSATRNLAINMGYLATELPNFAVSARIGIMSLSNNLPQLGQAISEVVAANKAAAAEGKAVVSVWKTIGMSMLSMQAILAVVMAAFMFFEKPIMAFIEKLFSAKKATDNMSLSSKALIDVLSSQNGEVKTTVTEVTKLGIAIEKYKKSGVGAKEVVDEYNKTLGVHYGKLKDIDSVMAAYPSKADAFIKWTIQMQAAMKLAGDASTEYLRSEKAKFQLSQINKKDVEDTKRLYNEMANALKDAGYDMTAFTVGMTTGEETFSDYASKIAASMGNAARAGIEVNKNDSKFLDIYSKFKDIKGANEIAKIYSNMIVGEKKMIELQKQATSLTPNALPDYSKDPKADKDNISKIAENRIKEFDFAKAMRDDELKANESSRKKDLLALDNYYADQIAKVEKFVKDKQDKLVALQAKAASEKDPKKKAALNNDISNLKASISDDQIKGQELGLAFIENKRQKEANINAEWDKKDLDAKVKAEELVKKGYEEELQGLDQFSDEWLAKKIELLDQEQRIEEMKNGKSKGITKAFDDQRLKATIDFNDKKINEEMKQYDYDKKVETDKLLSVKLTEDEKTRIMIASEIERQQYLLTLLKKGNVNGSNNKEIASTKSGIEKLKFDYGQVGQDKPLLEKMGFKKDEAAVIQESYALASQAALEWAQAEVDAANAVVEARQKVVDSAQSKLDKEIEARNAGYAANVEQANKDLALAKKNQDAAIKEQEKAQKKQAIIEGAMQASSMITAIANLFMHATKVTGFFGIPMAIIASGLMIGAFVASKVKANAATKAYGQGGEFDAVGGSHASGNDISLGVHGGVERRVEGGEKVAVFNRNATKRFGRQISEFAQAANKGILLNKYANRYNQDGLNVVVNNTKQDMSGVEKRLDSIKEQGEKRIFTDSKGRTVEVYKNVTRIYND